MNFISNWKISHFLTCLYFVFQYFEYGEYLVFNSHSGGGVQICPLGTSATKWLNTFPGWLWWWRIWWNEDWQEKPKYSERTCPSATLSTTNPTWPDPGRRGGKPATNRLSYGAAFGEYLTTITFQWLRLDLFKGHSWVGVSPPPLPHLRTETDPVSKTLCSQVSRISDDGKSPKTQWCRVLRNIVRTF
jgi:hypothetical protein